MDVIREKYFLQFIAYLIYVYGLEICTDEVKTFESGTMIILVILITFIICFNLDNTVKIRLIWCF